MGSVQVPKYQAIYLTLRQRILDGDLSAGSQLPSQQELAHEFGVTLMTLRQAMTALEGDGLVWAERGKGTFVADRPVDISIGNLQSFAGEMRAAGVELVTDVLEVCVGEAAANDRASAALVAAGELACIIRRRRVDGVPISVQRSYLSSSVGVLDPDVGFAAESLYDAIEGVTGWVTGEATETIGAVALSADDAASLDSEAGHPALLSIRTSFNQFGQPFLYDEALLVGGRASIAANRSSDRLSLTYGIDGLSTGGLGAGGLQSTPKSG